VRDRFAPGRSGLHHLAFVVDDLDLSGRQLVAAGFELAMSATTAGGTTFHFVDLTASHGHFVELYERSDRLARFYCMVADAAADWDGRDPVRRL